MIIRNLASNKNLCYLAEQIFLLPSRIWTGRSKVAKKKLRCAKPIGKEKQLMSAQLIPWAN